MILDARSAMPKPPPPDAALFEISWEVCNQVGGIYQVLRSKARAMSARWGNRYVLVGPRLPERIQVEVEPEEPEPWLAPILTEMEKNGWALSHGRWLVAGSPRVVLVDHLLPPDKIELVRHRLHRNHGIPPARGNPLVDDVLGFGEGVSTLLQAALHSGGNLRVLAHFHEWLSSASLVALPKDQPLLTTVFTTHATSVGRYLASSGEDLYARLADADAEREADRFGIDCQHAIEKASAMAADVFTTVSPITGEECEHLLGRAPDLVTPNGLDLARFDLGLDAETHHGLYKEQIHRFVMGHFFPSYSFDLDRTLYFFTAGRFEPRNKGFDLCLEMAARVNAELKVQETDLTVVLFIVTSRTVRSLEARALAARGILDDLEEVTQRIGRDVGERLFQSSAAGEIPNLDDLVDDYWKLRHRRLKHAFASSQTPLLCTHVMDDPERDPILNHLAHLGLRNTAEDRVKVVYHPEFISSVNPLWGMDYEHFVRGCHLGIFPSSYEPWGYTPLECLAMGIPSITSDLAGFGRYVADVLPDHDASGLAVLPRRGRGYHDAAADLTDRVLAFCELDRPQRSALRNRADVQSRVFDWSVLSSAYHDAHDRALSMPLR